MNRPKFVCAWPPGECVCCEHWIKEDEKRDRGHENYYGEGNNRGGYTYRGTRRDGYYRGMGKKRGYYRGVGDSTGRDYK